jgi:hypothetical protein
MTVVVPSACTIMVSRSEPGVKLGLDTPGTVEFLLHGRQRNTGSDETLDRRVRGGHRRIFLD